MNECIQQVKSITFNGTHPYESYDEIKNIAIRMEMNGAKLHYENIGRIEKIIAISDELIIRQQRLLTVNGTDFVGFGVEYIFDNLVVIYRETNPAPTPTCRSHLIYTIDNRVKKTFVKKLLCSRPFTVIAEILAEEGIIPIEFEDYIKPSSVKSARK